MRFFLLVFMIFILSGLLIISNNNLYMFEQENMDKFVDLYSEWLNQISFNAQFLTGKVIELNWFPE